MCACVCVLVDGGTEGGRQGGVKGPKSKRSSTLRPRMAETPRGSQWKAPEHRRTESSHARSLTLATPLFHVMRQSNGLLNVHGDEFNVKGQQSPSPPTHTITYNLHIKSEVCTCQMEKIW